jgi:hypothetical protein
MLNEPLRRTEAKRLILSILKDGSVSFAEPHAMERLKKRQMSTVDCLNILRAGTAEEAEHENGEWRYRVHTGKMTVVVKFEDETELMIVTAWRA